MTDRSTRTMPAGAILAALGAGWPMAHDFWLAVPPHVAPAQGVTLTAPANTGRGCGLGVVLIVAHLCCRGQSHSN